VVCSPRQPSGHCVSSTHRAGRLLAIPAHLIHILRRRCACNANIAATVCQPRTARPGCSPWRCVPSAHCAGAVLAPPALRSLLVIRLLRAQSARRAKFAVTACLLLGATRVPPPWRLVAASHAGRQLAIPAVCLPAKLYGHRVSPARRDGGVPAPPTFRSLHVNHLSRWLSASCIAKCHLLAALAVCLPLPLSAHRVSSAHCAGDEPARRLSGRCMSSAPRVGRLHAVLACAICSLCQWCACHAHSQLTVCHPLAALTFQSPSVIHSLRWPSASRTGAYHLLATPAVYWRHRLCGRRVSSVRHAGRLAAPVVYPLRQQSGHRVPSARRAGGTLAPPTIPSLFAVVYPHQPCALRAKFPIAKSHLLTAPPVGSPCRRVSSARCMPSSPCADYPVTACHPLAGQAVC
jgi:hypothetical protein